MIVRTAEGLRTFASQILTAAGAEKLNAACVAEHLVSASLSGVDTHGLSKLPGYVEAMRKREILATQHPSVLSETPTAALVTGNWTFGQVAALFAVDRAIEKAAEHGVAVVGLVQAHHIGRLGEYTEAAASRGMIAMVWGGGYGAEAPAAVPYGGIKPVLHTNPISMGFPANAESQVIFDFATTAISGVKVLNARRACEMLPPQCIVDRNGNPTTDPNLFFEGGAHLPFGGHKGYALMMAAEILGRILTGADAYADPDRGGPIMRHQGVVIIALKADIFQPLESYSRETGELVRKVRAVPPAPWAREVLVPGDPERRARAIREREGIPIPDDVWQDLTKLAESLSVSVMAV